MHDVFVADSGQSKNLHRWHRYVYSSRVSNDGPLRLAQAVAGQHDPPE